MASYQIVNTAHATRPHNTDKPRDKSTMKVYISDGHSNGDGPDPYSYDPAYLPTWDLPKDLDKKLPPALVAAIKEWRYAGAAVGTAVDRILELEAEGLYRGYPEATGALTRYSKQTPVGSMSPVAAGGHFASPLSPPESMASSFSGGLDAIPPLDTSVSSRFRGKNGPNKTGLESPPFTPDFTPIDGAEEDCLPATNGPGHAALDGLASRFSPLALSDPATTHTSPSIVGMAPTPARSIATSTVSNRRDSTSTAPTSVSFNSDRSFALSPGIATPPCHTSSATIKHHRPTTNLPAPLPAFSESSWETFARTFAAELRDLQTRSLPRFRATARVVEKLLVEVAAVGGERIRESKTFAEFERWWKGMREQQRRLLDKAARLRAPVVEEMWEARRRAGLHV